MSAFPNLRPVLISLLSLAACAVQPMPIQSETITAPEARADLERLYTGLQSAEAGLYAETPEAVFDARYQELASKYTQPITRAELHADLQRFAALARHGHTRIEGRNPGWQSFVDEGGLVFPFSLRVEDGEVIIAAAPEESAVQPGDRLRALEGDANPIWLRRFTRNISAETPELAYTLLQGGEAYYAWLTYGERAHYTVTISRSGKTQTHQVAAMPLAALSNLQRLDSGFDLSGRHAEMVSASIAYLRPGGFFNLEATTPEAYFDPAALTAYKAFIDEAFADFLQQGAEHLILDLRDNPGGDNSFSDPVIAWFADQPFRFASEFRIRVSDETTASNQQRLDTLPDDTDSISAEFASLYANAAVGEFVSFELPYAEPRTGPRFTGQVHVLVNRYSYSNAVSAAALIQDYGFGVIYGEPTRDMATTYGAMEHFELPHSGFRVGYPKAHIIRPNGKTESHPLSPDIMLPAPTIRGATDVRLKALVRRLKAPQ